MPIQAILKDLKTVKKLTTQTPHRIIADAIISATNTTTTTTVLSTLTPTTLKLILSDPHITTHNRLSIFTIISQNQTLIPFHFQFHHYAPVICSTIQSKRTISKLFNSTLKAYSDAGKFDAALETFDYMRNNGIEINQRTCFGYLNALIRTEQLGLGLDVLYKMMEAGVHVSVYMLTVMVDGLCKIGEIKTGRKLVKHAMCNNVKPNVVTFNTIIGACCRRWEFVELDIVLGLMEEGGVERSVETYKFLIDGFLSGGRVGDAERMVVEMCEKDLKVDINLWNMIVLKYCKLGKMESAFEVFDEMTERGVCPNAETYRIMVSGICGVGEMEAAKGLADKLQTRGIDLGCDVFGDLVKGCCKKGEFDDAVSLLSTMERKGLFGDVGLYKMVIAGLCESGRVEEATGLLSFVVKCGANPEFLINLSHS